MTQPNDGGPAFPRPASQHSGPQEGMSLRDWFAGQALAGLLACPKVLGDFDRLSKESYKWADAMLKARSQGGD